jgi:hypothetical protein
MRLAKLRHIAALSAVAAALLVMAAAEAQVPPYPPPPVAVPPPASPEAAEIAFCLCLRQSLDAAAAEMSARQAAYQAVQSEVAALDSQLQSARATLNVDNPEAVAQFRQLLERRDAAFRQSNGSAAGDLTGAVERYNARSTEYNGSCANRPRNPVLLAQVQASLICPPPR